MFEISRLIFKDTPLTSPGLSNFHRVERRLISGEELRTRHQPIITVAQFLAQLIYGTGGQQLSRQDLKMYLIIYISQFISLCDSVFF